MDVHARLRKAARDLINDIKHRYQIEKLDQYTCPYMYELAKVVEELDGPPEERLGS